MALSAMKKMAATEIAQQLPQNPSKLNATDSLNVGLGLVHNYAEGLGKKILTRPMAESMKEADMEVQDKNYLSESRKHAAAMELRDRMLEAKRDKMPLSKYKLSAMADALHKNFIERAANESIAGNSYADYQKIGSGLNKK